MIGESTEGGGGRKLVFDETGEAACRLTALAALVLFVPALVVSPAAAAPGDARAALLERRLGEGPRSRPTRRPARGIIGTEPGEPIAAPNGASPPGAARAFLDDNAKAFGLDDASREVRVEATDDLAKGRSSVRLQQVHRGVPIIAASSSSTSIAGRTCYRRAKRLRRSIAST